MTSFPLLDSFFVGIVTLLAALSFLVPNKMHPVIKVAIGVIMVGFGLVYIIDAYNPIANADKAISIRILLFFLSLSILSSNIGHIIIEYISEKKLNAAGLSRKKVDKPDDKP